MISESILSGQRLRLRPVEERDLPAFIEYLNDHDVRYWLAMSEAQPLDMEAERSWYEEMKADGNQIVWCLEKEDGLMIGTVGLHAIDQTHGKATLGIVIGHKPSWSKGYGRDAIATVLRYAFGEMGLRRVDLQVDEDNDRGVRCYESCGFRKEGLLRGFRLRQGKPINDWMMAVLREDWQG